MLKLKIHNCNRCEHEWLGKLENPKTCANPKCRTPYWNKPRIRKQNKTNTISAEKFYFYIENKKSDKTYSFVIIDNEIICDECNHKTCNHIFEIISDPKIRQTIAKHGIEFSATYENGIKELGKNIHAMTEFVQNMIDKK